MGYRDTQAESYTPIENSNYIAAEDQDFDTVLTNKKRTVATRVELAVLCKAQKTGRPCTEFTNCGTFELDRVRPPKSYQESRSATSGISCAIQCRSCVVTLIISATRFWILQAISRTSCTARIPGISRVISPARTCFCWTKPHAVVANSSERRRETHTCGARVSTPVVESCGCVKPAMFRFTPMVTVKL